MKWSGQNIYDLVSRFRNDVYLEDISTGTIASGAHLGLDSNNKIVKATDGGGDLTGITAGVGLSGSSLTGPVPTLTIDFSEFSTVTPTSGDFLATLDSDGANEQKTSTDNLATLFAGTGLTASSAVIGVDASQTQITGIGTITTGVWNGTAIASAYLDSDTAHLSGAQTFTGAKTFDEITKATFDGDKDVTPGDGAVIHVDAHDVTDTNTSASGTAAMYTHVNIEAPRLFATNESVTTTAAASLRINAAPIARTNQTITNAYALWVDAGLVKFDGALTVGGTITGNVTGALTGQADTVATIAGLAPNTATTQATQPNIDSIGTDGDTLDILADNILVSNATTNKPQLKLHSITDDATGPFLTFQVQRNDSGDQAGEDDDVLGTIDFWGMNDGTPVNKSFAQIYADIHDATTGQESGRLTFQVANHDGGLGSGLILTGGSADNEVDVTLGLGAASVVTIPGDIDLAGDIDVDGTLETDALTIGGATIAAIGTTAITTLGTIGTGVWQGTAIAQAYIAGDAINGDKIADDAVDS